MKDKTPLYHYPASYAQEHGEFEQYQASFQSNIACRKAIEKAINDHYCDYILGDGALQDILKQFDYERIFFVLAVTNCGRRRSLFSTIKTAAVLTAILTSLWIEPIRVWSIFFSPWCGENMKDLRKKRHQSMKA